MWVHDRPMRRDENASDPSLSRRTGVPPAGSPPARTFDAGRIPPPGDATLPFYDGEELRERWRTLTSSLELSEPALCFVFIERGTYIIPVVSTLPLPTTPNHHLIDMLMLRLGETVSAATDLSVACLLIRPGDDVPRARDRGWAMMIADAAAHHRVPLHPIFRAGERDVVPLSTTSTIELTVDPAPADPEQEAS